MHKIFYVISAITKKRKNRLTYIMRIVKIEKTGTGRGFS